MTNVDLQISNLVDEIADLILESTEMDKWKRETRERYQDMILNRVRVELSAREEA